MVKIGKLQKNRKKTSKISQILLASNFQSNDSAASQNTFCGHTPTGKTFAKIRHKPSKASVTDASKIIL